MSNYYGWTHDETTSREEELLLEESELAAEDAEREAGEYTGGDLIEHADLWRAAAHAWDELRDMGRSYRKYATDCYRNSKRLEASAELVILASCQSCVDTGNQGDRCPKCWGFVFSSDKAILSSLRF